MDEYKIFGPLTIRQLIYVLIGFGFCDLVYKYLDNSFKIPLIIIIAGIFVAMILNAPKVVMNEDYILKKKLASKNPEEFNQWILIRKMLIQSQIEFKKSRGAVSDPKLEKMLKFLDEVSEDKKDIESNKNNL